MGTEMGGLWLARDRPLESPADASQQIKVKVSWQNFPDTELHTMGIYTISSVPSITPGIWCMCVWNVYEHVCVCEHVWGECSYVQRTEVFLSVALHLII